MAGSDTVSSEQASRVVNPLCTYLFKLDPLTQFLIVSCGDRVCRACVYTGCREKVSGTGDKSWLLHTTRQ